MKYQMKREKFFLKLWRKNGIEVILWYIERSGRIYNRFAQKDDVVMFAGCQGMDKAGEIGLNYIIQKNPDLDKEKILEPLKERIVIKKWLYTLC